MKAQFLKSSSALLMCLSIGLFVACGDDSGGGAAGAGGAVGGTGGVTGGAGGAKAGTGGAAGPAVVCGGETCTVNATLKMIAATTVACCTTTGNKCGQMPAPGQACLVNNAPSTMDTRCTGTMVNNTPLPGCCTADKKCGINFTVVGFGCLARESLTAAQGGALPAISCAADDASDDAGM